MELECHLGYLDHKQWTSIWREQKGVREAGQVGESLGTRGGKGIHLSSMTFEPRLNAKELKVQREREPRNREMVPGLALRTHMQRNNPQNLTSDVHMHAMTPA